jgi:hypothetical protein
MIKKMFDAVHAKAGRAKAQAKYNSKPEQKKNRAARNRARYQLMKKGVVKKGDGMDVDHKDGNPQNNSPNNLHAEPKRVNRKDGGPGAK